MLDIVIHGATIVDGTGRPGYRGDLGIQGDRIACVGEPGSLNARSIVRADGRVVSPGFIDIHSHTDETVIANPTCESKVTQGVTTEVSGNCGYSPGPLGAGSDRRLYAEEMERYGIVPTWESLGDFLDALDALPMSINYATLVGHGSIRTAVVGSGDRSASPDELMAMCDLTERSLLEGAFGVSSGLVYPPGCYASTEELVAVSRAVARHGGFYATHIRSESEGMVEAVDEALSIGREAGISVQISHHKGCGRNAWGKVRETLAMIEAARAEGLDVLVDQYPYVATSTGLGSLLPDWAHDGGNTALMARLRSPEERHRLAAALKESAADGGIADRGGWGRIVVSFTHREENRRFEGMSMAQISDAVGRDAADAALDLLLSEGGDVGILGFVISEDDVLTVMRSPLSMIGSDATARSLDGPLSLGKPHPRAFGTFTRVLGRYSREMGVIPLETAVAKMTGLPARRLGLTTRGRLAPGCYADVVVFDPERVIDTATFEEPHVLSEGIEWVLVNGEIVVENGHLLPVNVASPGRVLRRAMD